MSINTTRNVLLAIANFSTVCAYMYHSYAACYSVGGARPPHYKSWGGRPPLLPPPRAAAPETEQIIKIAPAGTA